MTKPIGLSLVGCGQIARSHLEAIRRTEPAVRLINTVDVDPERAKQFAQAHGSAAWETDYHRAFAHPEVEAAILCLPHHLHAPVAIAAADAGIHVLCEKPLALNADEGRSMVARFRQAGRRLMVGHSRRFCAEAYRVREIVQRGELGTILHVQSSYLTYIKQASTPWRRVNAEAGGYLIPIFGTHLIDFILWATGFQPVRVYCQATSHRGDWEGEDEAAILLTLSDASGRSVPATVTISANCRLQGERSQRRDELIIAGREHTLRYSLGEGVFIDGEPLAVPSAHVPPPSNFTLQLQEFVAAIREDREPVSSGVEAARVMDVLDACHLSSRTHEPVALVADRRADAPKESC